MNRIRVFFAPDTGLTPGGGEEIVNLEESFDPSGFEEELFLVEGVDEIPDEPDEPTTDSPEIAAIKEQNALLQSQVNNLTSKVDPTLAMQKSIEQLGANLRPVGPVIPQVPVKTQEEIQKEFNDNFYNDPYNNSLKLQEEKFAPLVNSLLETNSRFSKQFLMLDPEKSKIYSKYPEEVDAVYASLPKEKQFKDPNAYKEASDIVASRHISDTMDDMKATLRAEIMAELKGEVNPGVKPKPSYSESGVTQGSGKKVVRNVLPAKVWEHAALMGIQGRGEKEDKARVYAAWKGGNFKVPGLVS